MTKHFLRLTTLIAAGIGQSAFAQSAGTFPIYPQVWTISNPPATSLAATDPNFTTVLSYKTTYGRVVGPYPVGLVPSPGDPASAAWAVVRTYQTTLAGKPLALQLNQVGTLGLDLFSGPTTFRADIGTTRLYQHPLDMVMPNGQPSAANVRVKRTPWMTNGIAETRAWSSVFFSELARRINESGGAIPRPRHVMFDEEIHVIGKEQTLADLILYWQAIQADPRFNSSTVRVPGMTVSLRDSWIAAGSPQLAVVTGPVNWRYWWGSENNQRWWTWWSQVCMTAYAGAIDQSFYQFVRQHFPATQTSPMPLCSDYDQSLVLDGAPNPELSGNGAANSYVSYESLGAYGPTGQRFVFKQPGDLSNIAQAPHLYGDFSLLHSQYFNGNTFGNQAWASSDDNLTYVPPQESWGLLQARMSRHRLAACLKSAEGRSRPIVPWLTLPNQFTVVGVDNGAGVQQYRNTRYPLGMPVRVSNTTMTRILAHCKSHSVQEVIVWNDAEYTVDNSVYNHGLHCHWPTNWNLFRQAAANAYGFHSTGVYGSATTSITPPADRSGSSRNPADVVAFADADYANPERGRLTVASDITGGGTWQVTRFRKATDNTPVNLEFNAELRTNTPARISLYVRGVNQPTWTQVVDFGLKSSTGGSMGAFPVTTQAARTTRLRACIPYNPDYFPALAGGATGEFHVALYIVPVDSAQKISTQLDLVQVYGVNPRLRPAGDIDGDYVYNPVLDRTKLTDIMIDLFYNTGLFQPRDRPIIDFDRNGLLNWNDLLAYDTMVANGGGNVLVDDEIMSAIERP